MTDTAHPEGSSGARSFLTCLGIGCGVVFVLVLIGSIAAFFLKDKIRNAVTDQAYQEMEREISESSLDTKEKGEVIGQLGRLRDGIKNDEVSMEELGYLTQNIGKSPLRALMISTMLRAGMRDSSFTSEERLEADDFLERYVYARVEGQLSTADDEEIGEAAGARQEEGGFQIEVETDNKLKPEKVRAALALVKSKVEEAGVPAVQDSPDVSTLLQDLLDPILE